MARNWHDNFAEFFGQGADSSVRSGRPNGPGMKAPKADFWDTVWGRSQEELNTASKLKVSDDNESNYRSRIEQLNGTWKPGQTSGQYQQEIHRLEKNQENNDFENSPGGRKMTHEMGIQTAQMQQSNTLLQGQLQLQSEQMSNQNNALIMQMRDNQQSRSFDRETSEANRMLTLQLANMNSDLQDKRLTYDRETRRMDRRDKNIALLMQGLGNLGGAFAL